jgi:hypothetical protein
MRRNGRLRRIALAGDREVMVTKRARLTALTFVCFLLFTAVDSEAQSILGQLATLLTEQRTSGTFVPDPAAAAATTNTVASLFLVEVATLPTAASTGGFVYRLRPDLGLFERASNEFGPFFTERTLRNGPGQASMGITYQYASFGSLQGADLGAGTFPVNAARGTGAIDPFSVDTLTLDFVSRSVTPFFTYGVTDRIAVGASVPIVSIRFSGQRMRTVNGASSLQSRQSGAATGLGDIVVNGRYHLLGTDSRGLSVGADLRLPTGREEDLLGTEGMSSRMLAIGSWEEGQLAVHANGGVGVGGVSREVFWSTATTFAAASRVTVVGELMGRYLSELTRVRDVYQPHPVLPDVETMRWLPSDRGVHTMFIVTGAKWNVASSWLVNASLLFRISDVGLGSDVTPAISIDYAFER